MTKTDNGEKAKTILVISDVGESLSDLLYSDPPLGLPPIVKARLRSAIKQIDEMIEQLKREEQ